MFEIDFFSYMLGGMVILTHEILQFIVCLISKNTNYFKKD